MPCANSFESFFLKVSHGKDHKENRDLRSDSNHRHLNFWIDRSLGIDRCPFIRKHAMEVLSTHNTHCLAASRTVNCPNKSAMKINLCSGIRAQMKSIEVGTFRA